MQSSIKKRDNDIKIRIKDTNINRSDITIKVDDVDCSLDEILSVYKKYKENKVLYVHKENHIKFLKDIKRDVPRLVKKIANNCKTIKWVELEESESLEEVIEKHKKYILIKVPYLLYGIK